MSTKQLEQEVPAPSGSEFPDPSMCPVSCNSWIVTKGGHFFETWDEDVARSAFNSGATVQTTYDYLVGLNQNS